MQPLEPPCTSSRCGRRSLPLDLREPPAQAGSAASRVPLEWHFPEGEVPSCMFEKTSRAGSPLTESNRRPSPYHRSPAGPCKRRVAPEQSGRWLALAATGHDKPLLAPFCPPKCPPNDLLLSVQWNGAR